MRTAGQSDSAAAPGAAARLVWDLPLRVAHWLIVLAVAGAWVTHYAGTRWFAWHRALGCATLVLVAFRITWGFVGTRHARFATFLRGPRAVAAYLRARPLPPTVGHNPLGAWSVVAMLAALLVQAATGLFANDAIANAGPFYGCIAPATSNRISGLHETNSKVLLALVVLHVLAIAWYHKAAGRSLTRAMLTGRKPASDVPPDAQITDSRSWLALAIVAGLAVLLVLAIRAAPDATIALY